MYRYGQVTNTTAAEWKLRLDLYTNIADINALFTN